MADTYSRYNSDPSGEGNLRDPQRDTQREAFVFPNPEDDHGYSAEPELQPLEAELGLEEPLQIPEEPVRVPQNQLNRQLWVAFWTIILSVPVVLVLGLMLFLQGLFSPLAALALLLCSVLTAILAAAVAGQIIQPMPALAQPQMIELLEAENNRLVSQLQSLSSQNGASRQQRQFFSSLTNRTHQSPDRQILFETTVQGARELLKTGRVVIYQFNPDWSGTIVAESVAADLPRALHDTIGDPCFKERYVTQYKNGLVTKIDDIYTRPGMTDCYIHLLEQYRVRANLVVPIRLNDTLFGLLIAHQCDAPRNWSKGDISFMTQLSQEVERDLEFIHNHHAQAQALKHAWFLGDIPFRARQTTDANDLLAATVKGTREILNADRVLIYRFNPDMSGTMIAESVGTEWPKVLHEKIDDPCFRGRYVELYKNGRVRAINNLRQEPGMTECHIRTLEKFEVKANLVAPIRLGGELMALLIVHQCRSTRNWQDTEVNLVSQIASQLEYALEHIQGLQTMQRNTDQARLFGDLAFRARQAVDANYIFRLAAQGALKLLQTDRILIYRFNSDWSGQMIVEALSHEKWTKVLNAKIEDPCFRGRYVDLYKSGRVRAISDLYSEPGLTDCHIRLLEQYEVKANLVAPLRQRGELFGLMIAHHCQAPRVWKKVDIDFFSELATQVEYALDHLNFIDTLESSRQTAEQASLQQRQQTDTLRQQLAVLRQGIDPAFQGNLTVRVAPPEGEVGIFADYLNTAIANLQQIVLKVQEASNSVIGTAQTSQPQVTQLAKQAQLQTSVINDSLDDIQTMATSIQTVAESAQTAKLKVQQADQALAEGEDAMNRTLQGILSTQVRVEETAQQVKLLGEALQNISRVVNLIRDLANQTNVLSLNAAIEASGSGNQEQGFGVVAEEVRSLAERSATATREVEGIVEEIQAETNQVMRIIEAWREQAISGSELVDTTRQKFSAIAKVSGEIRSLVESIAQSAQSHSQVSVAVTGTMQEVRQLAEQSTQQASTVAQSFDALQAVAQQLQASVAQFKV